MLAPYRVLDLTGEDAWLCGRILADLGADVIKVEPPSGDPGREHGPFYHDQVDPEKSLTWFAYNGNKRGITLDLETVRGQTIFLRMAHSVDFILESFKPGTLDERGIGYKVLHERSPRLVFTSITPFGQSGPYASYRGSDLETTALSGFMSLVGAPGRPPLRDSLPQAPMWTGMYAAAGTLVAHHYRQKTGKGQHVDVSMQACMLWALANAPAFYSVGRQNLYRAGTMIIGRSITGAKMHALYPCKDGHINFIIYGGEAGKRSNEAMVAWMAEEGMAPEWLLQKDWGKFNVATSTQQEIDQIEGPFAAFLAKRTKADFANEAVKREILGYPVNHAKDITEDPQLVARDFWQHVEHADLGDTLTYPGGFAKFSEHTVPARPAPRIGEHNEQVYLDLFQVSRQDYAELKQSKVI